jgi:hypothetical protein
MIDSLLTFESSCGSDELLTQSIEYPYRTGNTRFAETRDVIKWEPSARDVTSERIGMPHGRTRKFPF